MSPKRLSGGLKPGVSFVDENSFNHDRRPEALICAWATLAHNSSGCYGRGAPGKEFCEDSAAALASPSPSKGVMGPPPVPKQTSSPAGSANQADDMVQLHTRKPIAECRIAAGQCEGLDDDGVYSHRTLPCGIGSEVPDILNCTEAWRGLFGQKYRKGRIGGQALRLQIKGVHAQNLLSWEHGNFRMCVWHARCDSSGGWHEVKREGYLFLSLKSSGWKMSEKPNGDG